MMQKGDEGFEQLWRFLPSSDDANSMIQSYTLDNEGLVLDTNNGDDPNQNIYNNVEAERQWQSEVLRSKTLIVKKKGTY